MKRQSGKMERPGLWGAGGVGAVFQALGAKSTGSKLLDHQTIPRAWVLDDTAELPNPQTFEE